MSLPELEWSNLQLFNVNFAPATTRMIGLFLWEEGEEEEDWASAGDMIVIVDVDGNTRTVATFSIVMSLQNCGGRLVASTMMVELGEMEVNASWRVGISTGTWSLCR